MAFELLVELTSGKIDWKYINEKLMNQSNGLIEFFPITDFGDSKKIYLGMSVVNNEMSSEKIEAFKKSIYFLLNDGHSIHELYSSSKFEKKNIDNLAKKFFGNTDGNASK